jgi:hypothetical protein
MTLQTQERTAETHLDDAALAAYVTNIVLSRIDQHEDDIKHIKSCTYCQLRAEQLRQLTEAAFSGELVPDHTVPHTNLAFLPADLPWLIIQFDQTKLQQLRATPGARSRGSLVGRYTQSSTQHAAHVTIEVFSLDQQYLQGQVRIAVDLPDRDPLEQGGSLVALRMGERHWNAQTDETGWVIFEPVPLSELAKMRIEVTPPA